MLAFRRFAIVLLIVAVASCPTPVLAQQPRAGVVTTIEGSVTATRAAVRHPVPLKFKDDIFVEDRVATGDRSLARLLLGGRAVVTIRERSVVSITEVPGRSTIAVDSGKIALAVARERMRTGDQVEIRTPNAVAGIRGTVVVAEVLRASAQAAGGGAAVTTNFYVLKGAISAVSIDPTTRMPTGAPISVPVGQSFRQTGAAPAVVAPNPPVHIVTAGLQPSQPQHTETANQEQVSSGQLATAVALVQAIVGETPGGEGGDSATHNAVVSESAPPVEQEPPPVVEQEVTAPPIVPPLPVTATASEPAATLPALGIPLTLGAGSQTVTSGSAIRLTGGSWNADSAFSLSGGSSLKVGASVLDMSNTSVSVARVGQLADGSTVDATGALVRVSGGSLTADALMVAEGLAPIHVGARELLELSGGAVATLGTLVGGGITPATWTLDSIVRVDDGRLVVTGPGSLGSDTRFATLTGSSSTTLPRISLDATTLTQTGTDVFIGIDGHVTAAGPLLRITGSTIGVQEEALVDVAESGSLGVAGAGAGAALEFIASTIAPGAEVVLVGDGATVVLNRPLVNGIDATLQSGANPQFQTSFMVVGSFGTLATGGTSAPLVKLTRGSLTTQPGEDFIDIGAPGPESAPGPAVVSLSGGLVGFHDMGAGAITIGSGTLVRVMNGSTVTIGGPLVELADSVLDLGPAGAVVRLSGGSQAHVNGGPLVRLARSSLTASMLGFGDNTLNRASLTGSLLDATDSTVSLESLWADAAPESPTAFNVVLAADRPYIRLEDSTLVVDDPLHALLDLGTDTGGTFAGVVLETSGTHDTGGGTFSTGVTLGGWVASFKGAMVSSSTRPLVSLTGTRLTAAGLVDVVQGADVQLAGSLVEAADSDIHAVRRLVDIAGRVALGAAVPLVSLERTAVVAHESLLAALDSPANVASLRLKAPLLDATDSVITVLDDGPSSLVWARGESPVPGGPALPAIETTLIGTPYALVSMRGGALTVGTDETAESAIVFVQGSAAALDPDGMGTQAPIRHDANGPLFEAGPSASLVPDPTITVRGAGSNAVRVDTALLEATAPLISLTRASMQTGGSVVSLFQKSRVNSNSDLARLDRSTLNVLNGDVVRVNASIADLKNVLVMNGSSTVNVLNGFFMNLTGNSRVSVRGCLVCMNGTANVVNVTNALASNANLFGIPIHVAPGATFNLGTATEAGLFPGRGVGGNAITVNGSFLKVEAGSTLNLGP
jgi:hypothetical protein